MITSAACHVDAAELDKNGRVDLRSAMQEFELTIDLDVMLTELDKEQSGSIDYKEFKGLLD